MKNKIAIVAGLIPFAVAAVGEAQAQVIYVTPRVYAPPPIFAPTVPPYEALAVVRAAGFTPLTQPGRRGGRYLILASDRAGGQVRIVMNAYNARIIRVDPAHDPRFAELPTRPPANVPGARPRTRVTELPPPDVKDPPAPRASRDAAPDVTGSLTPRAPVRTPLPRPRPSTAAANHTLAGAASAPEAAPAAPARSEPSAPAATQAAAPPVAAAAPQENAAPPPPTETKLVPVAPLD